jgi:hypothetical protein
MKTRIRIIAAAFGAVSLGALGASAIAQEGHTGGRMGMMNHGMMAGMNHGMMGRASGSGHDHSAGPGSRQSSSQAGRDGSEHGMHRGMGAGPADGSHEQMGRGRASAPEMRRGMGAGMGMGMDMGMGMMGGGDATMSERQELHRMFVNHDRISRNVTNLPNGIRTVTESDDPELAKTILSHVAGMMKRVEESRDPRLPMQSPTLQTIFRNKDKIETTFDSTPKGIVVTQTSNDAETIAALQKHAAEVTDLVKRGMVAAHETMMRNAAARTANHDHR